MNAKSNSREHVFDVRVEFLSGVGRVEARAVRRVAARVEECVWQRLVGLLVELKDSRLCDGDRVDLGVFE